MKRKLIVATGIIALLICVAAVWWLFSRQQPEKLVVLKNTGLAYLENGQPAEAIEKFIALQNQAPDSQLSIRNLAVARVMRYQQIDGNLDPAAAEAASVEATRAINKLIATKPDSADGYILASRLASSAGDARQSLEHLEAARKLRPDDAAIWFDTYNTAQLLDNADSQALARQALAKCNELAPDNTFVLLDWLLEQAIANDLKILTTLTRAQQLLAPLEADVQLRVRVSIKELLEKAEAGARSGDWNAARRFVRMVGNVTRPAAIVQSDLQALLLHELELIQVDFPNEFYASNQLTRAVAAEPIEVQFVESESTAKLDLPGITDIVVLDFDLDGAQEMVVVREGKFAVLDRTEASESWQLSLEKKLPPGLTRILAADLDADAGKSDADVSSETKQTADVDFVIYGTAGVAVLENQLVNGERTLSLVEQPEDVQETKAVTAAALGDLDHDGDLDVIVFADKPRVLSNVDGLHFSMWPEDAILGAPAGVKATSATVVDWDRDIDSDVLLAGKGAFLLENLRHGQLRFRQLSKDAPKLQRATSVAVLDADANASWDLLSQSEGDIAISFTQTPAPGKVTWQRHAAINLPAASESVTGSIQLFDYDNDGLQDVLAPTRTGVILLRNMGNGEFAAGPKAPLNQAPTRLRGADIDADGDLDLIVATPDALRVFINQGGNKNSWLNVALVAAQLKGESSENSGRVNQYGIGSVLEVRAGASYMPRTVTGPVTHIGLGQRDAVDVLRVIWTNGIPDNHIAPKSETLLYERQSLKGSCPYLYTWDGEKFAFVTDLLWASPIGLVSAENKLVPARPWEWLKVPGEMLKPRDGGYALQITEELWEAAYFDQVELIAIDHPADIDIFTNEKVGPPSLATPEIYQVKTPLRPIAARDSSGRDILAEIKAIDDVYARPFAEKRMQGYTNPHFMELNFGEIADADASPPERITLFLTGWVYPTDTSINAQIVDNPSLTPPRPPHLLTPNKDGEWREVQGFTGFPGGKTKTIAIDVTHAFTGRDYRLRIATSMELYWDAAFLTTGSGRAKIVQQPAPLIAADLHYRGFSEIIEHPGNGPQRYDHSKVTTTPAWPPMQGGFTRFGNVLELVQDEDDRLVILGAGDEMSLRFAMPEKPCPKGWKRDFVIHNVGYDKDADLNTVYGQTVAPLPFRGMTGYPYAEQPPAVLLRDSRQYHTRRQSPLKFRSHLRLAE